MRNGIWESVNGLVTYGIYGKNTITVPSTGSRH